MPLPLTCTLTISFSLIRNSIGRYTALDSIGWKTIRYWTVCKLSNIVAILIFVLPGDSNDTTSQPLFLFSFSQRSTWKHECFFNKQRIVAAEPEKFWILRITSSSITPPLLFKKHFLKSYSINEKLNDGWDFTFDFLSVPEDMKSSRIFLGYVTTILPPSSPVTIIDLFESMDMMQLLW